MFTTDFEMRFGPIALRSIAQRLYELEQMVRTTNGIQIQPQEEFYQEITNQIDAEAERRMALPVVDINEDLG